MSIDSLIESAVSLRPLLRQNASAIEESRGLTETVANALHDVGAFRLQLPAQYDGPGAELAGYLRVIEELSRGDGSAGWCAMVGSESSACVHAFLAPNVARDMLNVIPRATVAFTVVGAGKAIETDDGYIVSGRWRFASGCRHSTWLAALCVVHDGDNPRLRESGAPLTRVVFARTTDAQLYDTWKVSGLRGTASDDFEFTNINVPIGHTFDLACPPIDQASVWRIPLVLRLAMSKAAAVCGIARGAMDALGPLLERKPFAGAVPSREEPRVQVMLAQAEGALESGRAYLYRTVDMAWQKVQDDEALELADIASIRLAIVTAAQRALETLHLMQEIAGTAAVLDPTFARNARDFEVARHHMQLQTHVVEDVGRVLVGMQPRNPMF